METSVQMEKRIAALRMAYAAFNRGDIDAAVELLYEQIEWSEPLKFPGGGMYYGREDAKRYLAQSRTASGGTNQHAGAVYSCGRRDRGVRPCASAA